MHADVAAGQREGVDGVLADREELEILPRPGEARAQLVQVIADLRIVDVLRILGANLAHDRLAEALLHLRREHAVDAPEVGQRLHGRLSRRLANDTRRQGDGEHEDPGSQSHTAMISPAHGAFPQ